MEVSVMSKNMKVNIIHTIIWAAVTAGLITIFSLPDTISDWGGNRVKTILLATFFLIGFSVDLALRIGEKSQKSEYKRDERDSSIQLNAVFKSFAILLLYIFIVTMTLYIKYESAGVLPIGWVWFIAYSVIAAANLLVGIFTISEYKKQGM
jgi:uncharacterized membrane protein